jgi:hypothetical protein
MPQAGIGFDTLDTGYDRKTGATFIVRHGGEQGTGNREQGTGKGRTVMVALGRRG